MKKSTLTFIEIYFLSQQQERWMLTLGILVPMDDHTLGSQFEQKYQLLNQAQKLAVDTIEGPVMVVAGPGTGKTQVLALRIANILQKTDTPPDGILCLTFTNSGVAAMQERLRSYMGPTASKVAVMTFHAFGNKLIDEHFELLDFRVKPILLDDQASVALCDEILHNHEWDYLRPRANPAQFFGDIKSLISLLKRERLSPEKFEEEIQKEILTLQENPDNISSRGATKGELKAEVKTKLEGLARTREVVRFYELYDALKKERSLIDYDDVLELSVRLVEISDDAANDIREKYLYVLVDEHQDSSGVQNEFLQKVWGSVELPNLFVVGDDRQLIYGFGGASLDYFASFKHTFPGTQLVTLTDNYRSSQIILDSAENLLKSSLVTQKLVSKNGAENHVPKLVECEYPRDEILACAMDIKKRGIDPNEVAVLVPKNAQVRSTMKILADQGLSVASGNNLRFFELPESQSLIRILKILANPLQANTIADALFDPLFGIPPLEAHTWLFEHNTRKLTLHDLLAEDGRTDLFGHKNKIAATGEKLLAWLTQSNQTDIYTLVQIIGKELLLDPATDNAVLLRRIEVVRTMLHLVLARIEHNDTPTLADVVAFIDRIQEYGYDIPLAVFAKDEGIKVMTLHASKGLEFDYVWIAHLDERSLAGGKKQAFTLPESIKEVMEEKSEEVIKRQLYVAITRAKKFCTLSYATNSYTGGAQRLATIIADMEADSFEKTSMQDTETNLLASNPKSFVVSEKQSGENNTSEKQLADLTELVKKNYIKSKVSVTLLNNFFSCPWRWYFNSLLQLPEPLSDSLRFGSSVHNTIEQILKSDHVLSAAELEKIALGCLEKEAKGDERFIRESKKKLFEIVVRWNDERLAQIQKSRESEKAISFRNDELPHLLITGKIDLVEQLGNDEVRVTDFKTGTEKTKSEIEKLDEEGRLSGHLRQLAMYSYLIQTISKGDKKVRESVLEYLEPKNKKNALYQTTINSDQVRMLEKDIFEYDRAIVSGEWINRTCYFKGFGKETECPYCKRAGRIFELAN